MVHHLDQNIQIQVWLHLDCYGVSVMRRIKKHLRPVVSVRVQKCSMCIVNAVVVLLVSVHTTPTAPSWGLNLSHKRHLRATAGALAFSKVMVTLMTPLLLSEISKSFHPSQRQKLAKSCLGAWKEKGGRNVPHG